MSVSEVMVMEMPACAIVCAMRSFGPRLAGSLSSWLAITNMSSMPMPMRMKGSRFVNGLSLKPMSEPKP